MGALSPPEVAATLERELDALRSTATARPLLDTAAGVAAAPLTLPVDGDGHVRLQAMGKRSVKVVGVSARGAFVLGMDPQHREVRLDDVVHWIAAM